MTRASLHDRVPAPLRPFSRAAGRRFRDLEYRARSALARVNEAPVFVLGHQKSGTSAIAALLGRLSGCSVTIDLRREVWRPTYDQVLRGERPFERYLRDNRFSFAREIVKEPNLTLLFPQLERRFGRARFAFVVRDPRDNLRSLLDTLRLPGDLPRLEPEHLRRLNPGWRLVLDGPRLGIPAGHYVELLAHRWSAFVDVYLAQRDRMAACRYEDFLRNKQGEVRRLAEALELPERCDIAAEVDVQYQGRGDSSVAWEDFFGRAHLARIEEICADRMRALGYAPSGG